MAPSISKEGKTFMAKKKKSKKKGKKRAKKMRY